MKTQLPIISAILLFSAQVPAYDMDMAKSYERYFSAFAEEQVPESLRQIPASTVVEMIKQGEEIVLVDVRTRKEQSLIGITHEPTLQLPMNEIFREENLKRIPTDRKVILTCKAGLRCTIVALALHHIGFGNIYAMKGGITEMNRYLGAKTAF